LTVLGNIFFVLLMCSATTAQAQNYPNKPIRVIVPWPAGGLVDVAARQLSNRLQTAMGQPIVIDNKLGAGGNVGADQASKAAADGYTMLFTSSALTMSTALRNKMPFDAVKDLKSLAEQLREAPDASSAQHEAVAAVLDLITLLVTVKSPTTVTSLLLSVMAVVPSSAAISGASIPIRALKFLFAIIHYPYD
jgi:tripartite-type tricarboxylate transporter receptor subunit TctC